MAGTPKMLRALLLSELKALRFRQFVLRVNLVGETAEESGARCRPDMARDGWVCWGVRLFVSLYRGKVTGRCLDRWLSGHGMLHHRMATSGMGCVSR